MKIDKTSIKAAIRENTQSVGGDRRKASALFREGRWLRACGVTAKGWELHAQAVSLKPGNYERWKGRALTLSAAFLNNTRYERCEPGSRAMPLVHVLREMVRLLKPCFPDGQAPTYDMVENWACRIDHPTRHDLMPEQQDELQQAA